MSTFKKVHQSSPWANNLVTRLSSFHIHAMAKKEFLISTFETSKQADDTLGIVNPHL